jgi:beta-mannanase
MNGDWYENWTVTRQNSADFKKAFTRYVKILRETMPTVYISWSPNSGDHTGLPVDLWYPGDEVVDCVAPDYYDDGTSDARVDVAAWNEEADDRDDLGNPSGPEAWRQFAAEHGKPICFPEWGLKPEGDGVDHPQWIKAVNGWMNEHANTATWTLGEDIPKEAAGKVLYSAYFNVVHGGDPKFTIHGAGANPKSAAIFPRLRWGNRR